MAKKRTRDRHLAKAAARRRMEREEQRRRRRLAVVAVFVVVALIGAIIGIIFFASDDEGNPRAAASKVACGAARPDGASDEKPTFDEPPAMTIDAEASYTATLATSCGNIEIELDPKQAPVTVNSFVFLAEEGFYDGTRFHRIANSIDIIQGGDPLGTGAGDPGYATDDELTKGASYTEGTVAMANSGPNTQGSQFFIVTGPKGTGLDSSPTYTIFGNVTGGLDVAKEIQSLPVDGETPRQEVYLESVTIDSS